MSFDVISDAIGGVTKGALQWSNEKIEEFVKKLKERKLAFIEEQTTIEIAREQYHSNEAKFYQKYIRNKEVSLIIKLGLTLRKLENDKGRLHNLREKVLRRYKVKGLHIAEFVQNGILNRYVPILLEEIDDIKNLEKELEEILVNIEKYVLFVKSENKSSDIIKETLTKIAAYSPHIFIVSGRKSVAKIVVNCTDQLKSVLKEYAFEKWSSEDKEILFFRRKLAPV